MGKEQTEITNLEDLQVNFEKKDLAGLKELFSYLSSLSVDFKLEDLDKRVENIDKKEGLSESEKELLGVLKNAGDLEAQISFINDLINAVEKRKEVVKEKKEATKERKDILSKNVDEMSLSEAKEALKYTQDNYSEIIERTLSFGDKTLDSLDSKREVNLFQESLIEKLYGLSPEKKFNNSYLVGYDNKKGNYIIKIEDFEYKIGKDGYKTENVNSVALANYFLYLKDNQLLNSSYISQKFGNNPSFLEKLNEIWSNEDGKYKKIAKKIFERNNDKSVNKVDISDLIKIKYEEKDTEKIKNFNNEMANQEVDYYFQVPTKVSFIQDKSKLDKVLELFKKRGKKLKLSFINSSLLQDYVLNDNVIIKDRVDLDNISVENLKANFQKIIYKLFNTLKGEELINIFEELIKKLLIMGINGNDIISVLKISNVNLLDNYGFVDKIIKKYNLEEKSHIEDSEFLELKSEYLEKKSLTGEKYFNLTNYITEHISNSEVMKFAINMIKNKDYGFNNLLIYTANKPREFSKELVKSDFKNIVYINEILRGDKEIIDIFLAGIGKDEKNFGKNAEYFYFLKPKNINRGLQILKFFVVGQAKKKGKDFSKMKVEEKTEIIESMSDFGGGFLSDFSFGNVMTGILKTNGSVIEEEYKEFYGIINSSFQKINFEHELDASKAFYNLSKISRGDNLDENINNLDENRKKLFDEIIEVSSIEDEEAKKLILLLLISKNENSFSTLRLKLLNRLKLKGGENLENIYKKYYKVILKIKDYEIEEIKKEKESIEKTISLDKNSKYLDKKGEINTDKIIGDVNSYIESQKSKNGGNQNEIDEYYAREFIEKNFSGDNVDKILNIWLLSKKEEKERKYIDKAEDILQYDIHRSENPEYKGSFEEFTKDLESGNIKRDPLVSDIVAKSKLEVGIESSTQTYIFDKKIYNYNSETGVLNSNGKSLQLSKQDKRVVGKNPEALKNLFNFSNVLKKVGLQNLWPIKDEIFTAISNVKGQAFKLDSDYLNENEIMTFLNSILVSVGEKKQDTTTGLDDMIAKIQVLNKIQITGGMKIENNLYGTTTIEEKFIKRFIPRGNIIGFLSGSFTNAISSKNIYRNKNI